jgi:cytochrome P450
MTPTTRLTKASVPDSLAVLAEVLLPNIAKGLVIRRPMAVQLAERLKLDRRAVRRTQRLHDRYGPGPVQLSLPFRHTAVVLEPHHAQRVLDESPDPFATETKEKRAALVHLEPRGALISSGRPRAERRAYNEAVLETDHPMHRLADRFAAVVREEAALVGTTEGERVLTWDEFVEPWFAAVRRVVFGDAARDDHELTDMAARLRADANWAFLKPRNDELRGRFFDRMRMHVERAEPGSLAEVMAAVPQTEQSEPLHQVPQWLFAFDPAGMATYRALAILASHPEAAERARREVAEAGPDQTSVLPFLRATVLESLRLWPTTPLIMRETTTDTRWDGGTMPAGTGVIIFANFFHRDGRRVPYADRFSPETWLGEEPPNWPLVPFSGGTGICPGRHIVLLMASTMLGEIVARHDVRQLRPRRLHPDRPLPATLDNYRIRIGLTPRPA